MLTPENNQTEIMRRESEYKPPRSLSHWLIGRPLSTADAPHQTIGKAVGLAVFASDALSSTAYATQEILFVLTAAGMAAYGYVFPISIAIVALLAIVTISYEQTIHAYTGGGGAYIVSRDNLGEFICPGSRCCAVTRLHPDRGRVHLFRCCPDRIRVPHP